MEPKREMVSYSILEWSWKELEGVVLGSEWL